MEGERCGITFYIPKTGGIMAVMLFPHDFYSLRGFFHSGGYYSLLDTGLNISKRSSGNKSVMSPICSKQSAKAVRRSYLHAA